MIGEGNHGKSSSRSDDGRNIEDIGRESKFLWYVILVYLIHEKIIP